MGAELLIRRYKPDSTTGFKTFAVCPRHTAKVGKHMAILFTVCDTRRNYTAIKRDGDHATN